MIAALIKGSLRVLCITLCCLLVGCASHYKAPFHPPTGYLFSDYKAPLQTKFNQTPAQPKGHGKASTLCLYLPFYLSFAWDDCSVEEAARDGNLAAVDYSDYEFFTILGIFGKMTVHAYGPTK